MAESPVSSVSEAEESGESPALEDPKGRSSISARQDKDLDTPPLQEKNAGETQDVARHANREQARKLQSSLLEIAESIELVKADHDKLEKQNLALQDYIGGLTRAMSKGQVPKGAKSSSK